MLGDFGMLDIPLLFQLLNQRDLPAKSCRIWGRSVTPSSGIRDKNSLNFLPGALIRWILFPVSWGFPDCFWIQRWFCLRFHWCWGFNHHPPYWLFGWSPPWVLEFPRHCEKKQQKDIPKQIAQSNPHILTLHMYIIHIILYYILLYCIIRYYIILYYIAFSICLYYILFYYAILYCIAFYYIIILYLIILYEIILYYNRLYIILCYIYIVILE